MARPQIPVIWRLDFVTGCKKVISHRPNRYGYVSLHRKGESTSLLHRLVWEETYGPIPEGILVCHKCDVPNCINPEHLFLGTKDDNNQDKVMKGRQARERMTPLFKDGRSARLRTPERNKIRNRINREYRENHRDNYRAYYRAFYARHQDRLKVYKKLWREAHKKGTNK